jgi:hypothetical protein
MSTSRRDIVAIALLTREEVAVLGKALKQVYKVDEGPAFADLLYALDQREVLTAGKG